MTGRLRDDPLRSTIAAVAALLWVLSASAEAQAPPPPRPEAPPLPGGQLSPDAQQDIVRARAEAAGPLSAAPPERWRLTLGLRGLVEENPRFQAGADDAYYYGEGATLALSRDLTGRRSQMTLSGSAMGSNYHGGNADRFEYSGGLAASLRPTDRTTLTTRHAYASSSARDSALLAANGLLVAGTSTRTYSGDVGLGTQLSRRTALSLNGGYRDVAFGSTALVGGWVASGDAQLTWSIRAADSLSLGYQYQRMQLGPSRDGDTHTGSLGWTGRLGQRWSASLQGGAIYLPARAGAPAGTAPYGAVDLTAVVRRSALTLRYGRAASPAFGFGRPRIADLASLTAQRPLGRRTQVTALFGYGLSHDPSDESFELRAITASGDLRWQLGQAASVGVLYGFAESRSVGGPIPPVSARSHRAALTMTFGKSW